MSTDFWSSSHYRKWIVDHVTIRESRAEDLRYVDDPEHLDFLGIFFANIITKLCKKLSLRQRVIATATVFFRRFYLKNSYCETEPFIVAAACCYVAAKAEESPVHIKNVITEARSLFSQDRYGVKNFPSDNTKLAEMEFYLLDDLECDLTVFNPYRPLLALCRKEGTQQRTQNNWLPEMEIGEVGVGVDSKDAERYWGTGEGQLELNEGALQLAWFIINDTYRADICLLYPPHLIAIAAIYLTLIFHQQTRETVMPLLAHDAQEASSTANDPPRRSSRQSGVCTPRRQAQDPVTFLAGLNVSMPTVANIAQHIISLYALWDRYKEDAAPESRSGNHSAVASPLTQGSTPASHKRTAAAMAASRGGSMTAPGPSSGSRTPGSDGSAGGTPAIVTPAFLTKMLTRMREAKMADLAHPASGRPALAVNKMLERTQAAG